MNLTKYIFSKWEKEAEKVDKFKVNFKTLVDSSFSAICTTQGLVSFLNLKNTLLSTLIVIICFVGYFHAFHLWHIGNVLIGIDPEDAKKNVKT
jgi:hypothetical protein